ncbi:endonuclease/exonuclease/phosphatase family protein [Streptomyces sp. NPDC056069]|uniref:endonuclease/exonuclease/phosphatase family protein n=1 Tax=Streptomyces sp. NPDC056069 TaxID=3345702 RepID=UPI0035D69F1C
MSVVGFKDHRKPLRRAAVFALVTSTAAASLVLATLPAAQAVPSTSLVIAEAYGGGGNAGATLTHDFIELANAGSSGRDLTGYSVQYLPGSPSSGSAWGVTPLTGSLAPGGRYLIREGGGSSGATALPAPDAAGNIAMGATSGTVALVVGSTALTCMTAVDCAADPRVVDLVGYGNAVVREVAPVGGASNNSGVSRSATLLDSDNNATDFMAGQPSPVNRAGQVPGGGSAEPGDVHIHDIQGSTRLSPFVGLNVAAVPGVVTGVRTSGSKGFWIQDPVPDSDARTSEGVFVHTGAVTPSVKAGDSVLVDGRVNEYRSAGPAQSLTEITTPTVTVLSSGNPLPAPVVLGSAAVPDSYTPTAGGGSIDGLPLQPDLYAMDFYESIEGARAQIADARVVGATNSYAELWVTSKPEENRTPRGGTVYGSYAQPNTGRIKVAYLGSQSAFPGANVGDELAGVTTGPVDYSNFGGYSLQATTLGTHVDHHLQREITRKQRTTELAVATFNVENLDARDPQSKFDRLASGIATNLAAPDIVALEEIQDDNGATNDGTVTSEATLTRFADAIVAAGGPRYTWRYIAPQNLQDGGEPGGNIRQVFLFNAQRVTFADRPGGNATTAATPLTVKGALQLSHSPGRINPTSQAWANSRKPLVGEFKFLGKSVFVIANHFASKGGDQPLHGKNQEPERSSETQRHLQAAEVNAFVRQILTADKHAQVITLGDLNDFEFSQTTQILTGGGVLKPLINTLPANERYSYVFDGNAQTLDHILTSPAIRQFSYDVVHINAEFSDQASDHDPQIIRYNPPRAY